MASIQSAVRRRGGIARTHELLADGHTSHQLTSAVRRGEVVRIRQGHYGLPELPEAEVLAIRIGGRLTGLAAARSLGIWAPAVRRLQVTVPPNARALRTARDPRRRLAEHPDRSVRIHWTDRGAVGTRSRLDAVGCLREIANSETPIVAFAAVESALQQGLISRSQVSRIGMRRFASAAARQSESGGESLLKFRLLSGHVPFRQQVQIATVGRVDFLVGERLVIEVDGAAFHTSRDDFENDRRRDAILASLSFRVLRFSYFQIDTGWTEVDAAIKAVLARGDHW